MPLQSRMPDCGGHRPEKHPAAEVWRGRDDPKAAFEETARKNRVFYDDKLSAGLMRRRKKTASGPDFSKDVLKTLTCLYFFRTAFLKGRLYETDFRDLPLNIRPLYFPGHFV